jgi:hypothetical protein
MGNLLMILSGMLMLATHHNPKLVKPRRPNPLVRGIIELGAYVFAAWSFILFVRMKMLEIGLGGNKNA